MNSASQGIRRGSSASPAGSSVTGAGSQNNISEPHHDAKQALRPAKKRYSAPKAGRRQHSKERLTRRLLPHSRRSGTDRIFRAQSVTTTRRRREEHKAPGEQHSLAARQGRPATGRVQEYRARRGSLPAAPAASAKRRWGCPGGWVGPAQMQLGGPAGRAGWIAPITAGAGNSSDRCRADPGLSDTVQVEQTVADQQPALLSGTRQTAPLLATSGTSRWPLRMGSTRRQ